MKNKTSIVASIGKFIDTYIFTSTTTLMDENVYIRIFTKITKLPFLEIQYLTYFFEEPIAEPTRLRLTKKNINSVFAKTDFIKKLNILLYRFDDRKPDIATIKGIIRIINSEVAYDEWHQIKVEYKFNEMRHALSQQN